MEKHNQDSVVAIIGVGYVGEHLMEVFSSAFNIIGYDVSTSRIERLRLKHSERDNVTFSTDERDLKDAAHFLVCVPTTLGLNGQVDSSHVRSAIDMLQRYATDKSIVVIESTVAVGMTRELLGPLAASRGILAGMSPEVIKNETKLTLARGSTQAESSRHLDQYQRLFPDSTTLSQAR
jgi:UDP-N-acetyl-D-mannosaminuronate dehydrogenase